MQHNYKLTSITFADENENQVIYFIIIFVCIFKKIPKYKNIPSIMKLRYLPRHFSLKIKSLYTIIDL